MIQVTLIPQLWSRFIIISKKLIPYPYYKTVLVCTFGHIATISCVGKLR